MATVRLGVWPYKVGPYKVGCGLTRPYKAKVGCGLTRPYKATGGSALLVLIHWWGEAVAFSCPFKGLIRPFKGLVRP